MSPSIRTMGFFMSEINFCNTKEQLNHLGEVVTGKVDGSPSGADIDTSTLPYTGQVRKTLPALEAEYQEDIDNFNTTANQVITDKAAEFDASIASKESEADAAIDEYRRTNKGDYAPGILLSNNFEFIVYNGTSYFATNPPYTTTATTPDADGNLFVGSYTTLEAVASEIGNLTNYQSNSVDDMVLGKTVSGKTVTLTTGQIWSVGGVDYIKDNNSNDLSGFRVASDQLDTGLMKTSNRLTTKTFTAEQIKSEVDGDSFVRFGTSSEKLQYSRITAPADSTGDAVVYIDCDLKSKLLTSASTTSFFLTVVYCDDVSRSNAQFIANYTLDKVMNGYKLTIPAAELQSSHLSVDVRLSQNAPTSGIIESINVEHGDIVVGKSLYNLIRPSKEWATGSRNTSFAEPSGSFLSGQELDLDASELTSTNVMKVSPSGSDSYLSNFTRLKFYNDVVRLETSPVLVRVLHFAAGDYIPYRDYNMLQIDEDLTLVGSGLGAHLCGGDELNLTLVSSSGGIDYYTAPWDDDNHYNDNVRSGAEQPYCSVTLINSSEAVYKYQLTPTTSINNVQAAAKRSYYDYTTGLIHLSFVTGGAIPSVHACNVFNAIESFTGVGSTSSYSLRAFNIHCKNSQNFNWFLRPDSYVAYPLPSSNFVSLHACSGTGASVGDGFSIYNYDHELIDCNFSSNGNDGFNHHFNGLSYVEGGRSWNNAQDGISHHEQQVGYVVGLSTKYNGAGNSTPAFGCDVYHKNCVSAVASDGLTNKVYAGTFCALASQSGGNAKAIYDNCSVDNSLNQSVIGYLAASLDVNSTATVVVKDSIENLNGGELVSKSGNASNVINIIN